MQVPRRWRYVVRVIFLVWSGTCGPNRWYTQRRDLLHYLGNNVKGRPLSLPGWNVVRSTMAWVQRLDWPAKSPDLNPISNGDESENRLKRCSKSVSELTCLRQAKWKKIPLLTYKVESMLQRINHCNSCTWSLHQLLMESKNYIPFLFQVFKYF